MNTKIPFGIIMVILALSHSGLIRGAPVTASQNPTVPAPTAQQVVARDANSKVWQWETYEPAPDGKIRTHIHNYIELATGMNYWNNGQWVESQEQIDVLPNGGAAAIQGQHQVYFPGDIYNGVIEMVTPDGRHLQSRPVGISYDDGSQTVFIAQLTNSVGYLVGSNQVVYPNAFTAFKADLVCTYRKSGFECHLVIREQPPAPDKYGLNPQTSDLQLVTEFFNTTDPSEKPDATAASGLTDTSLRFGNLMMGHGKAFMAGNSGTQKPNGNLSVAKTWVHIQGRTFLIEQLPFSTIAPDLQTLPLAASRTSPKNNGTVTARITAAPRAFPPQRPVLADTNSILLAANDAFKSKGVVLDYTTIIANQTNFTFQGDTTYYVNGEYNLLGTTTIEGGSVIKFGSSGQIDIDQNGTIACQTGPYRPAVFTSVNDNSITEPIGSGSPALGDVNVFLNINATNVFLHDLRFCYCWTGIKQNSAPAMADIWNCQFITGDAAIYAYNIRLHNVLISRSVAHYDAAVWVEGPSLIAENVTADYGSAFVEADYSGGTVALTNCLVTSQSLIVAGYTATLLTNSTVCLPSPASPIYQSVGGGNNYLTNGSPYRSYGTTNINPLLLAELRQKTTYPPIAFTNLAFYAPTNYSPQAARDTNTLLDIGYHYDPLDYSFGECDIYTNVTFTAGTAVGWFRTASGWYHIGQGIHMGDRQTCTFSGTATAPCYWVRLNTVQEQDFTGGYSPGGLTSWNSYTGPYTDAAVIVAQFLRSSGLAGYDNAFRDDTSIMIGRFSNCEFYSAGTGGYDSSYYMTNCLIDRASLGLWQGELGNQMFIINCTFHGGFLYLTPDLAGIPVAVLDSAFDGTSLDIENYGTDASYASYSYNAYTNSTNPFPFSNNDVVVTNFNWQSSWFGNFYLPTNSPVINMGNTNANYLGLYHFTTQTNQVKETNSIVDIGYHYVATDAYGKLIDSNGDGIPDYLADSNGNGVDDANEIPWNLALTNLLLWLKADAGVANSGGAVSTWSDQSWHGNNATQTSGVNQPQLVTNVINGLPVVRFDGTSSYFNLPSSLMNGALGAEAFVVLKAATNTPTANSSLWQIGSAPAYGGVPGNGYPASDGSIADDFGSTVLKYEGVPAQSLTQYHLYEVSSQSNNFAAWVNGSLVCQTTNNTVGFAPVPGTPYGPFGPYLGYFHYFVIYNGSYSGYFNGDIAEVLIFNRGLTANERLTVSSYLNGKYGLVPAVPATPTNLVATTISSTQIGLTWDAVLNGGTTQIAIERSTTSNGVFTVLAQIPGATSYVDTNLTAGMTYYYQVQAINLTQWSPTSNVAQATTTTNGVNLPFGSLAIWLKADAGLVQGSTNTPVNLWADQSGNGNNALQIVGSNQPVWVPGTIGDRPIVRFNGTNSYFNLPSSLMNGALGAEAFVVLKAATNTPTANSSLWQIGSAPAYGGVPGNGYPASDGSIADDFGSTAIQSVGIPNQPLTQFNVYEVSSVSTNWEAWLNGAPQYQTTNNTVGFAPVPGTPYGPFGPYLGYFHYFVIYNGSYSGYFNGDIAEVLIFNRGLTAGERLTMSSYLNGKYGLVPPVPATPSNLVAMAISPTQIGLTLDEAPTWNLSVVSVERSTSSNGVFSAVAQLANATSYIDTNLTAGTTYFYRVRAMSWTQQLSPYSGVASATTPAIGTDLPFGSLALWLKADAGLVQGNTNTPVPLWTDQSGSHDDAVQVSKGNQPLWVPGAIGDRPVVRFNGMGVYLNLSNFLGNTATAAEAFVVLAVATNASSPVIWQMGNDIGLDGGGKYPSSYDGNIWEDFGSISLMKEGIPTQSLTQYHLYEVASQNNNFTAWINGAAQFHTNYNVVGFRTFATLGTARVFNEQWYNNYFNGDIAEILVFNRALASDEAKTVGSYLVAKYNLALTATNNSTSSVPTGLRASGIAPYKLNLSWNRTSTNESGFRIERKLGTNGVYQGIGAAAAGVTNFVDATANATNQYFYRVTSFNYFAESGVSSEISPPTVQLTNWPANIFEKTTNVLSAKASDAVGTVSNVQFFADYTPVGTAFSSPYTINWIPTFTGPCILSALATDSLGNSQFSSAITVMVYLDSNGDGIPDYLQVSQGNNPLNPWVPPAFNTNDHTAPIINLLIPTNAVIVP